MTYDNAIFATGLRMQRAKVNIQQKDLAEKTGINPVLISQYEQGTVIPKLDKLWVLAKALDCTPNDLLCWPDRREA